MIYGYGEDSLTLWALGGFQQQILQVLGDNTSAEKVIAFYRPSFGRRGSKAITTGGKGRAEFGEFDAIVATPGNTFLVESKWTASSEPRDGTLVLKAAQIRRHKIMRCYLEEWRSTAPDDWGDFVGRSAIVQRLSELGVRVPGGRTRLAHNLSVVLGMLEKCGETRDVVLFFRAGDEMTGRRFGAAPTVVEPRGFILVGVDCRSATSGGFLPLDLRQSMSIPRIWVSRVGRRDMAANVTP